MTTVLKDVVSDWLEPEYVLQRVEDWEHRLEDLYSLIRSWLPSYWEATEAENVVMHEKLMQIAGVEPRKIPTLKLSNHGNGTVIFEPRGLWVLGTNGRVDVKFKGRRYFICDYADYHEQPDWTVVNASNWRDVEPLSQEWLIQFLN